MNTPQTRTIQSLTGQAKVESLSVIYNRVALLKSKNISRRLMQRENSQMNKYQTMNIQQHSRKTHAMDDSNISGTSQLNKYKFLDDKQSDDLQTNFWKSQNAIKLTRKVEAVQKQKTGNSFLIQNKFKKRFLNNAQDLGKVSRSISVRSRFQSNRVFLMSDFSRKSAQLIPSEVDRTNIAKKQTRNLQSAQKRPFTSSIGRQRISFRVNQLSKANKPTKRGQMSLQKSQFNPTLAQMKASQKGSKKSLLGSRVSLIKGQSRANTYKSQMQKFQKLYECLSRVLASTKSGMEQVQSAVTHYSTFIQSKNLSFIDDFMQGRQPRLQKLVRTTRLHQTLSICYLFLQMAEQKTQQSQTQLINFIGHSLSNLLLVVRLYVVKQRRQEFQKDQFQLALQNMQAASFGQQLTRTADILLRVQHNNEIITMIHKRLGREHQKFETCIQNFLRHAERQQYSCSLCSHYIFEFLAMHIHELQLLDISPTLQLAPQPYTPPAVKQYTLVIQPLGILQKNGKYRPYLNQFMKWASKNFDIVLWTWELPYAVQPIYQLLSPFITSRLYRHHCTLVDEIHTKDLSRLGRNLQKTIILDFDKRIYKDYHSNGVQCRWRGNHSDKNLLMLSQIFQEMISSATNIQDTLTFYAEEILAIRGY